jgi:hypothetical protein
MTEATRTANADVAWTARHEPPSSEGTWTFGHYSTVVDLIKHCDNQISGAHRYHMLSVGSMIPILAILLILRVPIYAFFATVLLGAALGIRWLTLTAKLNLEKMCWVSLARQLEERYLTELPGPFSVQQEFLDNLPVDVSQRDKIVMRGIGAKNLYIISIALFTLAVILIGIAATLGWLKVPM